MVTKGKWGIQVTGSCSGIPIETEQRRIGIVNLRVQSSRWGDTTMFKTQNEEDFANANLIVTAVNQCKAINPDNPMAVAENIEKMYQACKIALEFVSALDAQRKVISGLGLQLNEVLASIERKDYL